MMLRSSYILCTKSKHRPEIKSRSGRRSIFELMTNPFSPMPVQIQVGSVVFGSPIPQASQAFGQNLDLAIENLNSPGLSPHLRQLGLLQRLEQTNFCRTCLARHEVAVMS